MRLSITHTKNNTYFYMIKSYRDNGKNKTKNKNSTNISKSKEQLTNGNNNCWTV